MTTSWWNKFTLLLWKNGLLQWRHKIQTVIEILVPALFSSLLVLMRSLVPIIEFPNNTTFIPLPFLDIFPLRKAPLFDFFIDPNIDWTFVYAPYNEFIDNLISKSAERLNCSYAALENIEDMDKILIQNNSIAGILFDESYRLLTKLPDHLNFTLKFPSEMRMTNRTNPINNNWQTNLQFPFFQITDGPRARNWNSGGFVAGYFFEGFLAIQNTISSVFIQEKTAKIVPDIIIQRYPFPPYVQDNLLLVLETMVSFIMLLSFIYSSINTVKFITAEKEKQLKESMKIMGLPSWLHWSAWFIKSIILFTVSISLIVLLLKVPWYPGSSVSVFTYTNWAVLWLFLFIYSISIIMFCFMVSSFFTKANTASACTGLIFFLFYAPYTFTIQSYDYIPLMTKLGISIFSNTAMGFGFQTILRWEGIGVGLQWNNIFETVTVDDRLTAGYIFIALLLDALLYLLITLYVEKIKPGDFGVPEPWYFPFTSKFWCGVKFTDQMVNETNISIINENMEIDPIGRYPGIQIKALRKVYSNKKIAVQGLTLNMFEDQITVLLGHNGAGKTTTMSMLTGMFPPTSGTAIVGGKDIRTDIEGVRNSLGLCPQHNILFDELTVSEHIKFYSRLKGLNNKEIKDEVQKYVKLLELESKLNSQSKTLSGGMKRKLSVGVALCGGSKIVLLDEPTAGMDPGARRALWDLLQAEKNGRTILLSTHFMDEADILGDRIAIMAEGDLKCRGSPYFLKKRFGVGYHLICVKGPNCYSNKVTDLLCKYVPGVTIESDIGSELSYQLPEKYSNVFQKMFKELEDKSNEMGVQSYGISLTTLEEVFMKVGTDRYASKKPAPVEEIFLNSFRESNSSTLNLTETLLLKGARLRNNQILAMFKKKYWSCLRNWILFLIQILIPVAFIVITIFVARVFSAEVALPLLDLNLENFRETVTILETHDSVLNDSFENDIAQVYKEIIANLSITNTIDSITDNVENYWLGLAENILPRLNAEYIIGATITAENITAWFNNRPFHGAPIAVNTVNNAILKAAGCTECEINIGNFPLPFTAAARLNMLRTGNNMGFQLAVNIGFAMSFVSAFYILFYVKERVVRAKLLQFVSGVNVFTFWLTALVWDFLTYVITATILIGTLAIFQEEGFATFTELGRFFLLLLIFGLSMLPINYIMSLVFTVPSSGFTKMAMINLFTGISLFIVVFTLPAIDLRETADILRYVFMVFPHFALSAGINTLNILNVQISSCSPEDECDIPGFFTWDGGILKNLIYMSSVGLICFIVHLMIELRVFEGFCSKKMFVGNLPESEDEDVKAEKTRVNNMSINEIKYTNLVIQKMTKFYKKFQAVNQISVAVEHAECFGLLGVNGAGKTSTFKMLTGDESITQGEAWVLGSSLKNDMSLVNQKIGYCPQFDALIDDLTGEETLKMFALLRGVPNDNIDYLTNDLAVNFNFKQHIHKQVKDYSGGNKRKLSTAIALIGNPSVVYLDEPTTGMDPGAKRHLWDMVCKVRNSGKSIILTSHSMEECEALCTRLAIMVNGEFKCIGSTQHLKNKFSTGYILIIRIGSCECITDDSKKVTEYVTSNFPDAYLQEQYQSILTFYIPNKTGLLWSNMFGLMENAKHSINIEDYSLSQTSLEQVFLSFTKYQKDEGRQ